MINIETPSSRPRGRPRAFDRDAALALAGELFWRRGYEGASIAELTAAMGITSQSLYAAYGSKAALYADALAWYQSENAAFTLEDLDAPDVFAVFEGVLLRSASSFTRPGRPPGCMISAAVLTCGRENDSIAAQVADLRSAGLSAFQIRLARGVDDGDLKADTDTHALARFLGAVIQGMAVQARDGAAPSDLAVVATLAIEALRHHRS